MVKKKRRTDRISDKPTHMKLKWSGLRAKDYLSRIVTRHVKEGFEEKETYAWAALQIRRVLEFVTPEIASALFLDEVMRQKRDRPGLSRRMIPSRK